MGGQALMDHPVALPNHGGFGAGLFFRDQLSKTGRVVQVGAEQNVGEDGKKMGGVVCGSLAAQEIQAGSGC